jgi:hypothetical protein
MGSYYFGYRNRLPFYRALASAAVRIGYIINPVRLGADGKMRMTIR